MVQQKQPNLNLTETGHRMVQIAAGEGMFGTDFVEDKFWSLVYLPCLACEDNVTLTRAN